MKRNIILSKSSFPRKRESRKIKGLWIPASAGMTELWTKEAGSKVKSVFKISE
jgi:hypothetical protein